MVASLGADDVGHGREVVLLCGRYLDVTGPAPVALAEQKVRGDPADVMNDAALRHAAATGECAHGRLHPAPGRV